MTPIFEKQHERQLHMLRKRFGTLQLEQNYLTERNELFTQFSSGQNELPQSRPLSKKRLVKSYSQAKTQRTLLATSRLEQSNIVSKFQFSNIPQQVQFTFPKWMTDRKEFKDLQQSKYFDINLKIVSICEIDSFKRDDGQKTIVALYLQKLSLFKLMPFEMLFDLGGRLTTRQSPTGDFLCKQGDNGDCMYIIYKGEVQVLDNKGGILKVFGEDEHLGRNALETDAPRSATLMCSKDSYILILSRWDFQQCLGNIFKIERPKWKYFIESIHFFKNFKQEKIDKLCEELKGKFMSTKDCLYKVSDPIDNFYIVKNGVLVKTVVVDLEQANRWPVESKKWIKRTVVTRLKIPLKYQSKSLLGYYEIVTQDNLGLKARTETIDAAEDCFILYIPKAKFNDIFDADDQKRFCELHTKLHPTSFDKLIEKVKAEDEAKKLEFNSIKDAITDGLSNYAPSQLEQKRRKYQRVLMTAKKRLDDYRGGKEILKIEERKRPITSYYE